MLADGDVSEGEEDEGVSTPAIGSPKELVPGIGSEQAEPNVRAKDTAAATGEQATSHKDITKD